MRKTLLRALTSLVLMACCVVFAKTKDEWKAQFAGEVNDGGSNLLSLVTSYSQQYPAEAPQIAQAAAELLRDRNWRLVRFADIAQAAMRGLPAASRASLADDIAAAVVQGAPADQAGSLAPGIARAALAEVPEGSRAVVAANVASKTVQAVPANQASQAAINVHSALAAMVPAAGPDIANVLNALGFQISEMPPSGDLGTPSVGSGIVEQNQNDQGEKSPDLI